MASAGWKREGCPVGKKPLQAPAFCRSVPKTCPQGLARQRARRRLSSFPATFSAPGRGHHAEPLRLREVLRMLAQQVDFQALRRRKGEVRSPRGYKEVPCDAYSDNGTCRFAGTFLRREPSDGLEPSTPSLPWRIRAAGGGLRNSACYGVFPATTPFRLPDAPLPPRALSLPEKPRTCPQSPSPRKARPSRRWTPSAKRLR
jgi:hypothetical protein